MMLANHAEVAPRTGDVIYISGGGWDTVVVRAPSSDDGVAGVLVGSVAIRLLLEPAEAEREHGFTVSVVGAADKLVAQFGGGFAIGNVPDLPPDWPLAAFIVIQIAGLPVPDFGFYAMRLEVQGRLMGETRFRVIKGYDT